MILKPVSNNEKKLLLDWRNHPDTWKYFFDANPVKEEDHEKWFASTLKSSSRKIFICFNPDPIGMVRFDFFEDKAELSWIIAPEQRGKGFGVQMLKIAVTEFNGLIIAKIKKENISSIKIALKAGFVLVKEQDDHQLFEFFKK